MEEGVGQLWAANSNKEDDMEQSDDDSLCSILKELLDFRKDPSQQLNGTKEDMNET